MMEKPIRKKALNDGGFGAPDFEYIDAMFEWYDKTGNEINLKDFAYSEIQIHPELYNIYIKQFKND